MSYYQDLVIHDLFGFMKFQSSLSDLRERDAKMTEERQQTDKDTQLAFIEILRCDHQITICSLSPVSPSFHMYRDWPPWGSWHEYSLRNIILCDHALIDNAWLYNHHAELNWVWFSICVDISAVRLPSKNENWFSGPTLDGFTVFPTKAGGSVAD